MLCLHEVLPELRKTGSYGNSVNLEEVEQYILKVSEIEQLGLSKILEQRLSQYLRTNQKGER